MVVRTVPLCFTFTCSLIYYCLNYALTPNNITHSLNHPLIQLLTHLLTITHLVLTLSDTHSPTHSLSQSFAQCVLLPTIRQNYFCSHASYITIFSPELCLYLYIENIVDTERLQNIQQIYRWYQPKYPMIQQIFKIAKYPNFEFSVKI